jgi:putative ABC transport system permease protein
MSVSPTLSGPHLKEVLADVLEQSRVWDRSSLAISIGDARFNGEDIVMVDHSFFNLFAFKNASGNLNQFEGQKETIAVLSIDASKRMFGNENPIGKMLSISQTDYEVIAVIERSETDLDHSVYLPIKDDIHGFEWAETFVSLGKPESLTEVTKQINDAMVTPMDGQYNSDIMKISFQPISLSEMRFTDKLFGSIKSNKSFLYFLMALATILMLLCCLSVLNFESTISMNRIKEIATKKIFGASKFALFGQFAIESSLVFLLSVPLSFLGFFYFVPLINSEWNYNLKGSDAFEVTTVSLVLLFVLLYIVFMSLINYRLHAVEGTDGSQRIKNPSMVGIKKILLPFQLFICTLIVLFTSLATNQVDNIKSAKIGFDFRQVWVVDVLGEKQPGALQAFKEMVSQLAYVTKASMVNKESVPGRVGDIQLYNVNFSGPENEITAKQLFVDGDYFDLLGIEMDKVKRPIEDGDITVNFAMVKNHLIDMEKENTLNGKAVKYQVGGYFHDGVFSNIKAAVFENDDSRFDALLIKTSEGATIKEIKEGMEGIVKKEGFPVSLEIKKLEDVYFSKQKSDRDLLEIIMLCNYFIIAITIFGILSSTNMVYNLMLKQNMIRKILGATDPEILSVSAKMIYKETMASMLVAGMIAHLFFFQWQDRYALKMPISPSDYFGFVLLVVVSIGAFVAFFYFKVNKLKPTDNIK